MKMNKKIIFSLLIVLLFGVGVAYAGVYSTEAEKWFATTCKPNRAKSILAAICDLRERIMALENSPTWDEERIVALEARVAALENPTPPAPPLCTAILCEDFNSFSDGPIVNQGWTDRANGSTYLIQSGVVQEGAKALQNDSNSTDNVITKTGNSLSDGMQSVWIRTKDIVNWGNYNIGENVQFCLLKGSWDSLARTCISFMKDGYVAYLNYPTPDQFLNFATYNDNEWTLVDIEWRSSDKMARFRVNNGTWTDWKLIYNSVAFTSFDTVGFDAFLLGSGGVYFDNLH